MQFGDVMAFVDWMKIVLKSLGIPSYFIAKCNLEENDDGVYKPRLRA